jgi:predicted esterase
VTVATVLIAMLLVVSPAAYGAESAEVKTPRAECVVLLHGLSRTELSMKPLQWVLGDAGYTVINPQG